jgi:ubiquinone/menaquinone biosynthesis C-methylase UbiE
VYEVYDTNNGVIRWLGQRLVRSICAELSILHPTEASVGLDVGCGEGHMLRALKSVPNAGRVVGVDLDRERLMKARQVVPHSPLMLCDIRSLPFVDDTFDYAVAAEILEHIPDAEQAMREVLRVLKSGAPVVISVPHEPYFHWGNLLRGKHLHRLGRTPAHVNFWNRKEIILLANQWLTSIRSKVVFPWVVLTGRKS